MGGMNDLRRCRRCGGGMNLEERRWTGTGTELGYACPDCGYEVKMMPPGAVGSGILLWLFAATIITALLLSSRWYGPGILGWAFILLLWLGGAAVYLPGLWKLLAHPVAGKAPAILPQETPDTDPLRRGIKSMERRSFFGAPLLLLGIAIAILGAAAIFGIVRDMVLQ